MNKRDEEYMEYVYALEKLQQATAEFEHYDSDKVKCDWVHLADLLNAAVLCMKWTRREKRND